MDSKYAGLQKVNAGSCFSAFQDRYKSVTAGPFSSGGGLKMKALQKHLLWTLALAVGSSTVGVMQVTAQDRDHDRDQNQYRTYNDQTNNAAYQQGMRHGQDDRVHNREQRYRGRYNNDRDRAAYQAGYDQGYRAGNGPYTERDRRWHNGQDAYNRGAYGSPYGNYRGGNPAQEVGYQDGVNDGRSDRSTGHSFRPTQQQAYKNADHNYNAAYGDRQQYKNMYREAYQQGYQLGYNGGSYRR